MVCTAGDTCEKVICHDFGICFALSLKESAEKRDRLESLNIALYLALKQIPQERKRKRERGMRRALALTATRIHRRQQQVSCRFLSDNLINLTFVLPEKKASNEGSATEINVQAKEGENILRLAQRNDIALEGACEGR